MSIKKKSLLACVLALTLVLSITTAFATSAKPQEAEPAKTEAQAPAKTPAAPAPAKKTDTPAPAEKPEAPAPEKVEAPAEASAPAPEAAPAANTEAAKAAEVKGTPIYSAGKGTIKETGFNAQDGNFIRIDHGRGQESFYAHCASVLVKTGDAVTSGQTIATIGSSGMSTGPHLHFEFLVNGVATDPLVFERETFNSLISPFYASTGNGGGSPIIAIMNGTVLDAGMKEKGEVPGLYVEILYENNYSMMFRACQSILVKTGDSVKAGDIIAYSGEKISGEGPSNSQDRANEERCRQETMARMVNGEYPRNSRGETYGKYGDARYMGYEADLVGAVTTDGLDGWVYSKMLSGHAEDVMTPEQMADYQESLKMEGFHMFRFDIPVYDDDGNEIGVFERGIQIGNPFGTMEEAQEAVRNGEI